jgi:hypothetical protein
MPATFGGSEVVGVQLPRSMKNRSKPLLFVILRFNGAKG